MLLHLGAPGRRLRHSLLRVLDGVGCGPFVQLVHEHFAAVQKSPIHRLRIAGRKGLNPQGRDPCSRVVAYDDEPFQRLETPLARHLLEGLRVTGERVGAMCGHDLFEVEPLVQDLSRVTRDHEFLDRERIGRAGRHSHAL
ncbi:hypothetical protein D3C85_954680 [compost metagenome]